MDIVIISARSKHKLPYQIYVGRPKALGNPFTHLENIPNTTKVETVEKAVEMYGEWLDKKLDEKDPLVRNALNKLYVLATKHRIYLECWCMDELNPSKRDHICHAMIIRNKLLSVKNNIVNP